MNGIQLNFFKDFHPPQSNPLLTFDLLSNLALNILSLGIYGVQTNGHHRYRLQNLKQEQADLLNEINSLARDWKNLERELADLMKDLNMRKRPTDSSDEDEIEQLQPLKNRIQELKLSKDALDQHPIPQLHRGNARLPNRRLLTNVFSIVAFMGDWLVNLSSLGFYGAYQTYRQINQEKLLTAENLYLRSQIRLRKERYTQIFQRNMACFQRALKFEEDFIHIRHTEPAKAYLSNEELKGQVQKIQSEQHDLQQRFDVLQGQYTAAKEAENRLNALTQTFNRISQEKQTLSVQLLTQQEENARLRCQINNGLSNMPLSNKLGPIPAKFIPNSEELSQAKGAVGVMDVSEKKKGAWKRYARRYNGLPTAAEVFKVGFAYYLKMIFSVQNKKIKLNASVGTPTSRGAQVVYRLLAWEFIQNGHLEQSCQGYYELLLNNQKVKMVASQPEKVLSFRNGEEAPRLILHFQNRDDFTPEEEVLKNTPAARGMDPIAAKCLFSQFSPDQQKHLQNLLIEPAIEDHDLDYQTALAFMQEQSKATKERMSVFIDLICDIATVLEAKFKQNIAMQEWSKYINLENDELQPFTKQVQEISKISAAKKEEEELISWIIHEEYLAVMKGGIAQQEDFLDVILSSQEKYQAYFKHLKPNLLFSRKIGESIPQATWKLIRSQYHRVHNTVAGQGCLYSNLITLFMLNKDQVDEEHILKLKRAMAAYLDVPGHAAQFEGALKENYNFTVKEYQAWLRNAPGHKAMSNWNLTPTQIEIAAYTLGVRIALFSVPTDSSDFAQTKCQVDKYGRLVPVEDIDGHYFGPPTEEVFFMGVENNYTYYALFPKLNLKNQTAESLGITPKDFAAIEEIEKYWQQNPKE